MLSVYTLELEAIGDHLADEAIQIRRALKQGKNVHVPHNLLWQVVGRARRPWAARLTGLSEQHGFEREFLKPQKDWSSSNGIGSRGVYLVYHLREGSFYQVHKLLNWTKSRTYFCRVESGHLVEMSREEVTACLS